MKKKELEVLRWIENGQRRRVVATTIYKPMTSVELCRACQEKHPSLQPKNVWEILRDMTVKGFAEKLNSKNRKGGVYYLSEFGRDFLKNYYRIERDEADPKVCWDAYGAITTTSFRRLVLGEIVQPSLIQHSENTATLIKRRLREYYPSSIATVSRAIRELESAKLISCCEVKELYSQKVYAPTTQGCRIHKWMRK